MPYLATVDDVNLAPSYLDDSRNIFPVATLADARGMLWDLAHGWGSLNFHHLDGTGALSFGFLDSPTITLYAYPDWLTPIEAHDALTRKVDPYPDYQLSIGPRGGIRVDHC